ncbi:hypothetical protein FACS1894174_06320 [Bacteroidia bacterium]|nr:hypothetical protein FACS189455_1360 [Bacteroidia bacterium]GHV22115.1 hypothetical protein FACS1894174_06320 [Bacteroidia bacterium]
METTNANMHTVLTQFAKSSSNEWSVSIGLNPDGSYSVSSTQENGATSGTIPSVPSGDYVANGHSHGVGSDGVPSIGDLYSFLEMVANYPTLQTMYVYGTGWSGSTETYAINIHDRQAASNFLNAYPKDGNYNSFTHGFAEGSTVGIAYNDVILKYNDGKYDNHGVTYHYMNEAVALSYIMSRFNMGVTLSRKVDNQSFTIINTKEKKNDPKKTLDITTCQ